MHSKHVCWEGQEIHCSRTTHKQASAHRYLSSSKPVCLTEKRTTTKKEQANPTGCKDSSAIDCMEAWRTGSNKVNCVGNSAWNPRSDKTTSQWRKWKEPSGRNQSRRKNKLFFFNIKAGKRPDNIDGHTCKKTPQKSVALSRKYSKW